MPLLYYQCLKCKAGYGILHRTLNEEAEIYCPDCGSKKYKKSISNEGMSRKGRRSKKNRKKKKTGALKRFFVGPDYDDIAAANAYINRYKPVIYTYEDRKDDKTPYITQSWNKKRFYIEDYEKLGGIYTGYENNINPLHSKVKTKKPTTPSVPAEIDKDFLSLLLTETEEDIIKSKLFDFVNFNALIKEKFKKIREELKL